MAILDQLKALARGTNTTINNLLGIGQPKPAAPKSPTLTKPPNYLASTPPTNGATAATLSKPAPTPAPEPTTPSGLTLAQAEAIQRANQAATPPAGTYTPPAAYGGAETTAPDTKALSAAEAAYLASLSPSSEEQTTSEDLAKLTTNKALGLEAITGQAIPLRFITGQQAALERRASNLALPLAARLTALQSRRSSAAELAKAKLEIEKGRVERARPNEEKVTEFTDKDNNKVVVYRDKNTGTLRQQKIGTVGSSSSSTSGERQRAAQAQAITIARPILTQARNAQGYVNADTYQKIRNDYAEAIGQVSEFDKVFASLLSPQDRDRLGVGKANLAEDIGSVLAMYLSGGGASAPVTGE